MGRASELASYWIGILRSAAKASMEDDLPLIASALAYASFLAIPSALLLGLGVFSLVTGPETVAELVDRFSTFMPAEVAQLLGDSLQRLQQRPSTGVLMVLVGLVVAVWSATSAMTTYMTALNIAYDREDERPFVRKRLVALGMAAAIGAAVILVALLLVFGPYVERWVGDVLGVEGVTSWLWWVVQWPLLVAALLAAFAVVLHFAPTGDRPSWRWITPGALVALVVWIVASVGFALYAGLFGSYNKTWGSLAAVIVTLTWLWLTGLALLFGGEVNAEVDRSRALRTRDRPARRPARRAGRTPDPVLRRS